MAKMKSLYKRAAELGLPFGAYLSAMALAFIYCDKLQLLAYVALIMVIGTPVVVYWAERRHYKSEFGMSDFSALWMMGLMMTMYGAFITGFVTYVVFNFLRPEYFYDQTQALIELYKATNDPQMQETVNVLQKMMDQGLTPHPIEIVMTMFWLVSFLGSILSALVAIVVKKVPYKEPTAKQTNEE